jgi:diguanylate cyclase (GGDEF)-like protein
MTDDNVPKPVVLVADDDRGMRDSTRTFFEVNKYRADSASNLASSLNVFHHYPNDLMVGYVDIHMHGSTDGLDIIQYGHEVVPHRVVLYGITGMWTTELERKVFAGGGHGLLPKDENIYERMMIRAEYPNALGLVEKSTKDPLTKLKNFSTFQEDVLLEMIDMKERSKWDTLHLMVFDLRSFKEINDTYGHLVGDRCLKHVAGIIKSHVRRKDYPCRYGGDEFLICMAGITRSKAIETARAIQQAVADSPIEGREGILIPLAIDWGLAELHRQQIGFHLESLFSELINEADKRMYDSKNAAKEGRSLDR